MNRYLLLRDNQEKGPYSLDELKSMQVNPDDLVWIEGKSTIWTHLKDVRELESLWPGESRGYSEKEPTGEKEAYQPTAYPGSMPFPFDAPSLNDS